MQQNMLTIVLVLTNMMDKHMSQDLVYPNSKMQHYMGHASTDGLSIVKQHLDQTVSWTQWRHRHVSHT